MAVAEFVIIYRVTWLVSIDTPAISDGAVALTKNRIVAVGHFSEIRRQFPDAVITQFDDAIIMPPLVNVHTHLELSYLQELGKKQSPKSFIDWVENLIETRLNTVVTEKEIILRASAALQDQYDQGVIGVADTGNLKKGWQIGDGFKGKYVFFHEYLGLSPAESQRQLDLLSQEEPEQCCIAHGCYSTGLPLLRMLKERGKKYGHLFSIHTAETEEENEFVRNNTGPMRDFLEKRGAWNDSFIPTGIDKTGSVQYLHQLGLLDASTLCVHCVHVNELEIKFLAQSGTRVCLCPGSNRFLGAGKAPVPELLDAGILLGLGTDSLASNSVLSVWNEMQLLAQDHPGIEPESILAMATLGGAKILGINHDFGRLAKGMSARMLLVTTPKRFKTSQQVMEFLVHSGTDIHPRWL